MDLSSILDRSWLEIDLAALKFNAAEWVRRAAPADVLAVVKANSYGLGTELTVPVLLQAGVKALGAATLREAQQLLPYGVEVRILSALMVSEIAPAVNTGITLPVCDLAGAQAISAEAVRQNKSVPCQLAIDSGMGRIGIPVAKAPEIIPAIMALPGLDIRGMYSHFPNAAPGDQLSRRQIEAMQALAERFKLPQLHLCATEGMMNFPEAAKTPFNMVRIGIGFYGIMPDPGLKGCVKFKSRIVGIRRMPAGTTVSYGRLHRNETPTLVGTVCAGYADGVPLALTNCGAFLVRGKRCHILGRVTMDYTMISLDQLPEAQIGDEVTLFDSTPGSPFNIQQWAEIKKTHLWDILCAVSSRVMRRGI